jgi:hypothetical protein
MGVRFPGSANQQPIVNTANTAETAVLVSQPLNLSLDFQQVIIIWYVNWTPGASTTTTTWRLRRGNGITGAALTTQLLDGLVVGNRTFFSGMFSDVPGAVAGIQYSVTGQQTGGTAPGVVSDGNILVFAL